MNNNIYIKLLFLFYILRINLSENIQENYKELCHSGNYFLSTGFCKDENNLVFLKLGNNSVSPCPINSTTLSWNFERMQNGSFKLFNCKLKENGALFLQVGSCGTNSYQPTRFYYDILQFSNNAQYFTILSCNDINIKSYKPLITSSKNDYNYNTSINEFISQCNRISNYGYNIDSWLYGNDIECLKTETTQPSTTTCQCAEGYYPIVGSNKFTTSIPPSTTGGHDPRAVFFVDRHYRRSNYYWEIPLMILSILGLLTFIGGLVYYFKRSANRGEQEPLLG